MHLHRNTFVYLAAISLNLFGNGCIRQVTVSRPAVYSVAQQARQAGLSTSEQQRVDRNCPFGAPRLSSSDAVGPTRLIARDGYVLLHSAKDKIPLWVCEFVERRQLTGKLTRSDKFQADPLLRVGERAELADYRASGYDRGHQAPAGDETTDARLKSETFYLSNMAPQIPAFNQQVWRELEDTVRKWLIERSAGYIITGPMFYDPAEENPALATGIIKHKVIGKDAVSVPTHFYKIAVAQDRSGTWKSIGFVMENRMHKRPFRFEEFVKSIDWIEQRTGIDFMPTLPAQEEKRLERQPSPLWN